MEQINTKGKSMSYKQKPIKGEPVWRNEQLRTIHSLAKRATWSEFAQSLIDYWNNHGRLSDKQWRAARNLISKTEMAQNKKTGEWFVRKQPEPVPYCKHKYCFSQKELDELSDPYDPFLGENRWTEVQTSMGTVLMNQFGEV